MALAMVVLPLAIIAAVSLGARISQHGWTPERMWGVVAVGVALAYGFAGWWAVVRARAGFDDILRPLQTRLALGVCGLAVLLALPLVDFGAISARSQMARLASGRLAPEEFDWRAMAFAFGPAGRARLADIVRSGSSEQRELATTALAAKDRYAPALDGQRRKTIAQIDQRLRVIPAGRPMTPALNEALVTSFYCRDMPCVVTWIDDRRVVATGSSAPGTVVQTTHFQRDDAGAWHEDYDLQRSSAPAPNPPADLSTATVELRTVTRKQLFVDGMPVGDAFP